MKKRGRRSERKSCPQDIECFRGPCLTVCSRFFSARGRLKQDSDWFPIFTVQNADVEFPSRLTRQEQNRSSAPALLAHWTTEPPYRTRFLTAQERQDRTSAASRHWSHILDCCRVQIQDRLHACQVQRAKGGGGKYLIQNLHLPRFDKRIPFTSTLYSSPPHSFPSSWPAYPSTA